MTFASGTALCAIEGARQSDLANIRWLLNLEDLPSADITEHSLEHFLVYRDSIGIAGVVGLERFGDDGGVVFRSTGISSREARERTPAIEHCAEFQSHCPSSAVLMVQP
jgi:hypothetical protein